MPRSFSLSCGVSIIFLSVILINHSRVCTADKTKGLESRIDLALSCPGVNCMFSQSIMNVVFPDESAFAVSAHYNSQLDQLLVLFGVHVSSGYARFNNGRYREMRFITCASTT